MGVERTRVVGLEVLEMPQEVNQWDGVQRGKEGVVGRVRTGKGGFGGERVCGGCGEGRKGVGREGSLWGGNGECLEGRVCGGKGGCEEAREDIGIGKGGYGEEREGREGGKNSRVRREGERPEGRKGWTEKAEKVCGWDAKRQQWKEKSEKVCWVAKRQQWWEVCRASG